MLGWDFWLCGPSWVHHSLQRPSVLPKETVVVLFYPHRLQDSSGLSPALELIAPAALCCGCVPQDRLWNGYECVGSLSGRARGIAPWKGRKEMVQGRGGTVGPAELGRFLCYSSTRRRDHAFIFHIDGLSHWLTSRPQEGDEDKDKMLRWEPGDGGRKNVECIKSFRQLNCGFDDSFQSSVCRNTALYRTNLIKLGA